ncbi:MAG: glycosyltransferase [Bacteroidales bacterium]|nr:glycosyltransferase [Bacteroidales bacterium]
MKILLINKFDDKGGAAIATKRLFEALKLKGLDVKLLVQKSTNQNYFSTTTTLLKNKIDFARFAIERLKILTNIKDKQNLFFFDSASFGEDISTHPLVLEADIIHLNWINFGFLSLKTLQKLIQLNKPIFWTMHDMWPITGGCFHSRGCQQYQTECKNCPFLKNSSKLAKRTFSKKLEIFKNANILPIAISTWMKEKIESSAFFRDKELFLSSNTIDTDYYTIEDKKKAKEKLGWNTEKIQIGFAAFNVSNKYKGGEFVVESIKMLQEQNPTLANKTELIAIGKEGDKSIFPDNIKITFTGYIENEDKMRDMYRAFDLFLMPSLEESLSLVTQEAMSCGTPVVAFNNGGQTDLIDHKKNGYLAEHKNSKDLKKGIEFILNNPDSYISFQISARNKIVKNYSYPVLAENIIEIYKKVKI